MRGETQVSVGGGGTGLAERVNRILTLRAASHCNRFILCLTPRPVRCIPSDMLEEVGKRPGGDPGAAFSFPLGRG